MRFIDEMIDRKRRESHHDEPGVGPELRQGFGQGFGAAHEVGPPPGFDRADLPEPLEWPPQLARESGRHGSAGAAVERLESPASGTAGNGMTESGMRELGSTAREMPEPEMPRHAFPDPELSNHPEDAGWQEGMASATPEKGVAPVSRLDRAAPMDDDDWGLGVAPAEGAEPRSRPLRPSPFRRAVAESRPAGLVGRAGTQPGRRRLSDPPAGDRAEPVSRPAAAHLFDDPSVPPAPVSDRPESALMPAPQSESQPLRLVDPVRAGRDMSGTPLSDEPLGNGEDDGFAADFASASAEAEPIGLDADAPEMDEAVAPRVPETEAAATDLRAPQPEARLEPEPEPRAGEGHAPRSPGDDGSLSSAFGHGMPASEAAAPAAADLRDLPEPPPPAGRVKTRLLGFRAPDGGEDRGHDPLGQPRQRAAAAAPARFPVGWLVVERGPGRGTAFALFDGLSTLGRGEGQTVQLDLGDTAISRDTHAAIAYDDERRACWLGHGGKANLVRLNGRPVLTTEALSNGDRIRIGETTLRFVALCGPDFSWSDDTEEGAPDAAAL